MKLVHFFTMMAVALIPLILSSQEPHNLYKVTLYQAAPGRLLDFISLLKTKAEAEARAGEPAPFMIRHSQGDHWDLMVIAPMGTSYSDYYRADRAAKRELAAKDSGWAVNSDALIALQEDVFVTGPGLEGLRTAIANGSYFHVEMFQALPGQMRELYREREMENAYQLSLKRPVNFIFVRDQGAAWDLFTLGVYRDLKHYAASADISEKDQEDAARAAGFASASQIGPYLRRFIRTHHDTLATAVR